MSRSGGAVLLLDVLAQDADRRAAYGAGEVAPRVQLRYNYRLYPSPGQQRALARGFGCARVEFNDGLVRPAGGARRLGAVPH